MEQIGYGEYIANTVKNMPYKAAIQTEDIAEQLAKTFALPYDQARTLTNVKLKRMADKGEIKRLQKGVYCHVKQTVFGKTTPNIDEVVIKTLTVQNGTKIGYESGASLFNRLGLTTLIPRDIEITTNRYGGKLPEGCHIKVRKPTVDVTDENWKYLQFIDLINELPNMHIDAENPRKLLTRYAQKRQLDSLTLIYTARRHYSPKILQPLIDLLMDVKDEVTSG
jgi:hypothetical protein